MEEENGPSLLLDLVACNPHMHAAFGVITIKGTHSNESNIEQMSLQ